VISNPSVTMVLMTMVLSVPFLVTQMVISFISPWKSSFSSSGFFSALFSYSSNWVGVLMFESSLTWYAPTVLLSSTWVCSLLMVHPAFLNSFSYDCKSLRFSDSALISSSMMLRILLTFYSLPKLNLGVVSRSETGAQRRAAGKIPLVIILEII